MVLAGAKHFSMFDGLVYITNCTITRSFYYYLEFQYLWRQCRDLRCIFHTSTCLRSRIKEVEQHFIYAKGVNALRHYHKNKHYTYFFSHHPSPSLA